MNKANMKNWSTEEVTILVWICCRYAMFKSRELSTLVNKNPKNVIKGFFHYFLLVRRRLDVHLRNDPWEILGRL